MDDIEDAKYAFSCPDCQAGLRRLKYVSYFTWYQNQMISVPNFPAWVCDICGKCEYDARALSWLNSILSTSPKRSAPATGALSNPMPGLL